MFPAGTVVGENAFDSKTPASGPRSRIVFRSVVAHGFRGFIGNQGAFNLKENVEAVLDGVTVHASEIGFRLRGPALVTLRNAVTYANDKSVRYEDGIADLRIVNVTFADAVAFQDGGGGLGPGFTLANGLFRFSRDLKRLDTTVALHFDSPAEAVPALLDRDRTSPHPRLWRLSCRVCLRPVCRKHGLMAMLAVDESR
jgi:hypothetical protein